MMWAAVRSYERRSEMEVRVERTTNPKEKPDMSTVSFGSVFTDHMFLMDHDPENGWHDARIVPYGPLPIQPASTVLQYAAEVFEGLKAYRTPDGSVQIFRPDENAKRMNNSAERMALPGMDDQELTELFRRAHGKGKITAMDASVNVADYPPCHLDLLRSTMFNLDIFIPSYEEASWLAQKTEVMDIMEVFSQFPFRVFGIKLGADGCILTEKFRDYVRKEPFSVLPVVDTTGAGDCFMGGFLCAWMKGWSLEKCAEFGSEVAAFGISAVGPSTAVPDYGTVFSFLKKHATGW